jgi:histidinol-phosphate/aromatic aminotransferase/cobyric acid decarboxylase-like protein
MAVPCGSIPIPEATELARGACSHHGVQPNRCSFGNGSDEVLAHAFVALLKRRSRCCFGHHLQLLSRMGAVVRVLLKT